MSRSGPAAWRGATGHARPGEDPGRHGAGSDSRGRVLVAVGHAGNRTHLIRQLEGICDIVEPSPAAFAHGGFDLAIVDRHGLERWHEPLREAKYREEPTFLPVVVILPRTDLQGRPRAHWNLVDEFVTTPVDPHEFRERVALLLRTRRLAIEQRSRLAYLVNHDRVTGLPNANLFMEHLAEAIREATVLGREVHVGVANLPLARVLASLGQHGADTVAAKTSARLVALLRDDVTMGRLSAENWAFLLPPTAELADVLSVCRRVREVADAPVEVGEESVRLVPRIGLAVHPTDGGDAASILDAALSALADVRGAEPRFYSNELRQRALRSIRTEAGLHQALEEEQFELWYQPQIALATGRVEGVEALVRWRLPSGRLVPPDGFLPVAESTGLIRELDRWVLRHACGASRRWRDAGQRTPRIAVNVVAQDVQEPDFDATVLEALAASGLEPGALEIELTETALLDVRDGSLDVLRGLRDRGVRIAVDDFGTGYSSLGYLHALPITTLKIDRRFVDGIDEDSTNEAITETIQLLAERFGLETVAEGVETRAEEEVLRRLGVQHVQGYFYGRPMPEEELRAWLAARDAGA